MKWDNINTMTEEYRPRESELRKALGQIIASKDDTERREPLRQDLADLLNEMEEHVRPINSVLIREMAEKLQSMVNESAFEAPRTGTV